MTDIASWYRPPEGADLVDGVTPDGMNVCREVAIRLFDCYAEECIADGGAFEDFQHTFAYSLAGGLVFRLFDEERGANNWALEFVADPGRRAERAAVLTRLPVRWPTQAWLEHARASSGGLWSGRDAVVGHWPRKAR